MLNAIIFGVGPVIVGVLSACAMVWVTREHEAKRRRDGLPTGMRLARHGIKKLAGLILRRG